MSDTKDIKRIVIPVRCQDCIFHKRKSFGKSPCSLQGVLDTSPICASFTLSHYTFRVKDSTPLVEALKTIRTKELVKYAALINQERKTRSNGYYYGQPLYIRLLPSDYVSNYCKCWVIYADSKQVYVYGMDGYHAAVFQKSVLTEEEYLAKITELTEKGRVIDPDFDRRLGYLPTDRSARIRKDTKKGKVQTVDKFFTTQAEPPQSKLKVITLTTKRTTKLVRSPEGKLQVIRVR